MMELIFIVTDLIQRIKDAKKYGYDLNAIDPDVIDPSLTECWVVIAKVFQR